MDNTLRLRGNVLGFEDTLRLRGNVLGLDDTLRLIGDIMGLVRNSSLREDLGDGMNVSRHED